MAACILPPPPPLPSGAPQMRRPHPPASIKAWTHNELASDLAAQGPVHGRAIPPPSFEWPDNYQEDPDCPGMGVWWCPHCGAGKPQEDTLSKPLQSPFKAPSKGVKEDTQHPSMGVEITNA